MNKILLIVQVCVGALLTASILIQSKGAALGETFGGNSVFYGSRRGAEKTLFILTLTLAIIFIGLAYVLLFV